MRQHPLRERLRGQQMLALYRAGRQADALEAYRSAYPALVDGLGIEPSPELRALEAAILRQDVPRRTAAASAARAPVAVDARRLVTCVFAQLTHRAEHANLDAESLRTVLGAVPRHGSRDLRAVTAASSRSCGSDAVLVVFGTPIAHEDDPQRALRAAAELVAQTEQLPFGLRARCGVCTGEVVAPAHGPAPGTGDR